MKTIDADFLVVGSGIAGLMSAHYLSAFGKVVVATKTEASLSNTQWAQGGISCVVGGEDSFQAHIDDTLDAGAGLCDADAVKHIVEGGPAGIKHLEELGVLFDKNEGSNGGYDLGKEGGHTNRRVLHAGDITGASVIDNLLKKISENQNIDILEHCMAIDLVTTDWLKLKETNRCIGAYFLNKINGEIFAIRSRHTVLATGGAGKVYLYTTNPDLATGDGIAMAWRAGLPIHNMEFIQFHPTCLFHTEEKSFLISEAVRGEGGILINSDGEEFVSKHDERGSLAPRDIVARAIDHEMKSRGDTCVYVDITHKDKQYLQKRFPNIYAKLAGLGVYMEKDHIPVVPAAHYCCGGIRAEVNGVTDMPGLFAVGETSCTGLHGSNRLASNSLLEGLVCAKTLAEHLAVNAVRDEEEVKIPDWQFNNAVSSNEAVVVEHNWNEVRTCMWDYVGIERTNKRLERAKRRVRNLRGEIQQYYMDYLVTADTLELRNIADIAEMIVRAAMERKESRGLHYTLDYPETFEVGHDSILKDEPWKERSSLDKLLAQSL